MQRAFQHHRTGIVAPALSRRFLASSNRNRITPASGTRGLSTSPNQNMFSEFQEIEVVGTSLNKSGAIVEVTTRGGGSDWFIIFPSPYNLVLCQGTEIVGANIDTALAGDTAGIETLLVQAAQDAYEQVPPPPK